MFGITNKENDIIVVMTIDNIQHATSTWYDIPMIINKKISGALSKDPTIVPNMGVKITPDINRSVELVQGTRKQW